MSTDTDPTHQRPPYVRISLGLFVAVLIMLSPLGFIIKLDKVLLTPGSAAPVGRAIDISGTKVYHPDQSVDFLTVDVTTNKPSLYQVLEAWLDSNADVEKSSAVLGDLTQEQDDELNRFAMDQSQIIAKKVALERLGYNVSTSENGAFVIGLTRNAPATSKIKVGDLIIGLNGMPITSIESLLNSLSGVKPRTTVAVTVKRNRQTQVVQVKTGSAKGHAQLGILATTELKADFPVNISIDTGKVSGPSAGLAFTLTILDELSPGSLLDHNRVAATGEVDTAGNVEAVGGVRLKAVAARRAGVRLLIVPSGEERDAKKSAGKMKVIGVKTVNDALATLAKNGGADLPPASQLHPQQ